MKTPAANRSQILRCAVLALLFVIGALVWVGRIKQGLKTEPIISVIFLQMLLTVAGVGAGLMILVQNRGGMPRLWRSDLATFLLVAGLVLLVLGGTLHPSLGPLTSQVLLYMDRWMLPGFALLVLHVAQRSFGVRPMIAVYGIFAGALVVALCVEAARAGAPIPVAIAGSGRYGAFLGHPNQYGIVTASTAPLLIVLLLAKKWLPWLLGVAVLGVYVLTIFQSLSKTNIVLLPMGLILALLLASLGNARAFSKTVLTIGGLSVAVALAAVAGFGALQQFAPREAKVVETAVFDPRGAKSIDEREDAWEQAIGVIKESPVLGKGPGWSYDNLMFGHAHNLYLQAWIDAGIPGVAGACILTLGVLLRLARTARGIFLLRRSGAPLGEKDLLQTGAATGLLIAIFGNSMSASFDTVTFTSFSLMLAFCFRDWRLYDPARATGGALAERPAHPLAHAR